MSAPAPATTRVLAQARFDAATTLRNGEQLLVSLVLPALALVGLVLAPFPDLGPHRVDVVAPGAFGLAILSSAFTGQAIGTGFDRRYGVLRLLGTTPLGRGGLLAARCLTVLLVQVAQFALLGAVAAGLGWRPGASGLAPFVVAWLLGTAAFVAFALLFAGTLRAEAVLALANLLWILFAGAGGLLLAPATYPAPWDRIVALLPSAALGDALRAACLDGAFAAGPLGVLLAWGALFAALAARFFRWSD